MKAITIYEASDGTRFDNEASCVEHEKYLEFENALWYKSDIYWGDTNWKEVAAWLWKNFDIKRKEK